MGALSAKGSTAIDECRAGCGCGRGCGCFSDCEGVKSRAAEGVRWCLRSWRGVSGVRNGLRFEDGGVGDGARAEELAKLWWSGTGIIVVLIEGKAGTLGGADWLLDGPLPTEAEAEDDGINVSPDRNDLGSSLSGMCWFGLLGRVGFLGWSGRGGEMTSFFGSATGIGGTSGTTISHMFPLLAVCGPTLVAESTPFDESGVTSPATGIGTGTERPRALDARCVSMVRLGLLRCLRGGATPKSSPSSKDPFREWGTVTPTGTSGTSGFFQNVSRLIQMLELSSLSASGGGGGGGGTFP